VFFAFVAVLTEKINHWYESDVDSEVEGIPTPDKAFFVLMVNISAYELKLIS
jgi:hypothetical protein